ncbi:cytochrome c [Magnetospira sp. QH-2]|uniref:c-type cytochrome n=1 Tax=Magnetospira sp. (strain QH-2) TaxID=1288970 RepID=UPI0003E80F2B|nr:cytochrome c [Magnetospira sp. QH-2]CCQ73380.1 exported protein of unknown function [Magnetospira sp. QH-2]
MKIHQHWMAATALCLGMALGGTAVAQYWGAPWSGPGPRVGPGGPQSGEASRMTHERQNLMRDHGQEMLQLKQIFEGRRHIDRREAARMAREIESGAGENLWRLYRPGTRTRHSRSLPLIWEKFDIFKGYAEELKNRAGILADELAMRPTKEDAKEGNVYRPSGQRYAGPPWRTRMPNRSGRSGGWREETFTQDTVKAFSDLIQSCHQCHDTFRIPKWW